MQRFPLNQNFQLENLEKFRTHAQKVIRDFNLSTNKSIEVEFIGGLFQNVKDLFTNSLTSISNFFSSSGDKVSDPLPHFLNLSKATSNMNKFTSNPNNYINFMNHEFQYMLGCQHNLMDMGRLLVSVNDGYIKTITDVLDEIDTYVSNCIASEDFRMSNRPMTKSSTVKKAEEFISSIEDIHSKLIDPSVVVDHQPLSTICKNLTELNTATNYASRLKNSVDNKALQKTLRIVDSLAEKIQCLSKDIDSFQLKCTQTVIEGLKVLITIGAKAVTSLSTYYYFVSQYANMYCSIGMEVSKLK